MSEGAPRESVTDKRPNTNRRWRCGFEQMGMACTEGPSDSGVCCQVTARKSCDAGGAADCEAGCAGAATCEIAKMRASSLRITNDDLGPCIPVRAAWFSRQTLALNVAILVGGILLCAMAIPQREAIFVPGTLSTKHSQILGNRLVSDRCSQCHPNSHSAIDSTLVQDDLCMKCHTSHLPDAVHRSPHDLTATQFRKLASHTNTNQLPLAELDAKASNLQQTQCVQCHIEHRGSSHNLQAITDQRCQACHQTKFRSFEDGHPEFEDFPYRTERRIAFDHSSHEDKHFAQKNESFDCKQCHLNSGRPGEVGPIARSVGFESSCARCHAEPIRSSTIDGWALLQLPSIDAKDALNPALGLQTWPAAAQYGYDGRITTPMLLLLAADPEVAQVLPDLPASQNIADIAIHKPSEVAAVHTLALGLQRMIAEVSDDGQTAWKRRLARVAESSLKRELTSSEFHLIDEMVAGLPPDLFRQIERNWFSGAGQPLVGPSPNAEPKTGIPARLVSGQELLVEDDLLAGQNADSLLLGDDEGVGERLDSDLLLDSDSLLDAESLLDSDLLLAPELSPKASSAARKLTKILGSKHVSQSGWYLDSDLLAVRYMPKGHADPLLAAWTEFALLLDSANPGGQAAIHSLGSGLAANGPHRGVRVGSDIPGGCSECHLLPSPPSILGKAAWTSAHRPLNLRLFTKFNHAPHLALPMVQDCRYCHVQNTETASSHVAPIARQVSVLLPGHEPRLHAQFPRNEFKSMQQSQCNACHHQGSASSACTQCHNYHVGSEGFNWSQSR